MLTAVGEFGIKEITTFLNIIPDLSELPTDLKKSVYIAMPKKKKKPGTFECDEPSHKSYATRSKILPEMFGTQFRFIADKSTRNAIFSLKTLIERVIEVQKDFYLCFIDYSKAFDKVKHSYLFDILLRHNCDGKDLRVIRNLYL